MKQEVVHDFLNLPGIVGVALVGKRSRPYFYGVDQTLNFQQKEALAQGVLQVFETIPDGFESFKFQFAGYQVYIYKLDREIILLVLTQDNLILSDYLKTIKNLKAALSEDITNAIAAFRLVAGSATMSGINPGNPSPDLSSKPADDPHIQPVYPSSPSTSPVRSDQSTSTVTAVSPLPVSPVASSTTTPSVSQLSNGNLNETIVALNHLSKFTTRYLGTHVVVNYWKSTRPDYDWLQCFQIDRSAQINLTDATPQQLQASLTFEQRDWIHEWVAGFIKRCTQVIRDFPTIVQQKALTDEQKSLLLG